MARIWFGEGSSRKGIREFVYYHCERNYQGLDNQSISPDRCTREIVEGSGGWSGGAAC
jgi:hypothetical protein